MASQDIHVYLDSNAITPIVHAVQNDTGRRLYMHITDEVISAAPSAARLYFVRPDGSHYNISVTIPGTWSNYVYAANSATAPEGADNRFVQVLTKAGKVHCQLQITDAVGAVSSHTFIVDVQRSANALTVEQSGYDIDDLVSLAAGVASAAGSVDTKIAQWESMMNSLNMFTYGGYVPTGTNLNTLTGYKFYHLVAGYTYTNWSVGGGGVLFHETLSSGNARQIAFKEVGIYYRKQVSGTWYDWVDIIGDHESIDDINQRISHNIFKNSGKPNSRVTDLDTIAMANNATVYYIDASREYAHMPVNQSGILITKPGSRYSDGQSIDAGRMVQIYITDSGIYSREIRDGESFIRPWRDVIARSDAIKEALQNSGGQPVPVTNHADMTDRNKTYLYVGSEDGWNYGHWYYYGTISWVDSGQYAIGLGGDYSDLLNKPRINNVTLEGNKTGPELGLVNSGAFHTFQDRVETELESIHAYYQATGSGEEISLTSGTITQIPLISEGAMSYGDAFEISDGGIKVTDAGIYKVAGSVYMYTDSASTREGCYIKAGPDLANAEELVSIYLPTGDTNTYGGIGTPVKVVELDANDVIYLLARQTGGASSVAYSNNPATFLYVEKMDVGFRPTTYGQPTPIKNASDMVDPAEVYIYVGEETGYTYGHWYYFDTDENEWTDSGLYGAGVDGYSPTASVIQTQTGATITITDQNGTTTATVENGTATDEQVDDWFEAHPEAFTNIADGAVTEAKLASGAVTASKLDQNAVTGDNIVDHSITMDETDFCYDRSVEYSAPWLSGPSYQSTTIPYYTISEANLETAIDEMPDTLNFVYGILGDYFSTGRQIGARYKTNSYSNSIAAAEFTSREFTINGTRYGVITVTKEALLASIEARDDIIEANPTYTPNGLYFLPGNAGGKYNGTSWIVDGILTRDMIEAGFTTQVISEDFASAVKRALESDEGTSTDEETAKTRLTGKVIIALGDSYTYGMNSLLTSLATKYGMVLDNRGVVSSSVCGTWSAATGTGTGYRPMWRRATEIVNDYTTGYTIDETTYTIDDVAFITFMGGANDGFGINTWIGDGIHETDTSKIYGACNHIFNTLLEGFPKSKVICITQPSSYSRTVSSVEDDATAQAFGFENLAELQVMSDVQFSNYAMALKEDAIKEVAWTYGIPIIDMFHDFPSIFNPSNRSTYWSSDKLHLSSSGYSLISKALDKKVVELTVG